MKGLTSVLHLPELRRPRGWRTLALTASTLLIAASTACGASGSGATGSGGSSGTLTIAMQQDIAFSPLYIIDQEHWLDQALPGVKVHWEVLNSGAAIQTGMISDKINVGALGVAPFLLGQSKGVPWKLLSSLSESDMSLVVKPGITSFRDITPADRIAVVSPTSIEAIALEKMASAHLGKATALTSSFVTMTQPQAAQAFSAGSIAGVVAVAPYTERELKAGGHVLDTSFREFGKSTLDSVVVNTGYYKGHTALCQALSAQIKRAIDLLTSQPAKASAILAAYYHGAESQATLRGDITDSSQTWTTVPAGYLRYAGFMKQTGLLSSVPSSMSDLEEPTLAGTPGS